ncbi:GGDEF domain-containing protein [Luteimonas vadosa]|uniref:diguanylate cyclase n=1 Tax=Luteimonas vadosa TaxID=1165507 RepID=A0ABP9DUD3_9GAMM
MREAGHPLGDLLKRLLARPDEVMLELGAGGELLVARIRAVLSALVLALPLIAAAGGSDSREVLTGMAAAVLVNAMAQVWLALARGGRQRPWLPYATATYDVTLTSAVLLLLSLLDPVAGINSMVVWCFYAIAIAITALRNDGRLTLYAGGLAIVQYAALVGYVFAAAEAPETLVSVDYGTASVSTQVERLVLLLMMTVLTATIVYRMQRLVALSGRDGLTGLPNRAWLLQRLPQVFGASRNVRTSLTLALVDIDDFARINDEIGHLGGDRVLRHFATTLAGMAAENELLARIGGQEFVMLLHGPIGSAWERLDRLRRAVAGQRFLPERGDDALRITFSAGLAAWPQDGSGASSLLKVADQRLKQAKREGRNRVVARDA